MLIKASNNNKKTITYQIWLTFLEFIPENHPNKFNRMKSKVFPNK